MTFKIISAYFWDSDDYPELLINHLEKYCTRVENYFYIYDPTFEILEEMIDTFPKEIYNNTKGWKPDEYLIDFNNYNITLRDYWLE